MMVDVWLHLANGADVWYAKENAIGCTHPLEFDTCYRFADDSRGYMSIYGHKQRLTPDLLKTVITFSRHDLNRLDGHWFNRWRFAKERALLRAYIENVEELFK